jgi:hypothetical protein
MGLPDGTSVGLSEELFVVGDADEVSTEISMGFPIEGDIDGVLVEAIAVVVIDSEKSTTGRPAVEGVVVVSIGLVVGECDGI